MQQSSQAVTHYPYRWAFGPSLSQNHFSIYALATNRRWQPVRLAAPSGRFAEFFNLLARPKRLRRNLLRGACFHHIRRDFLGFC